MTSRRPFITLFLALVAASQIAASCASSPDNSGGHHTDDYDKPNRIPHNSDLVKEGTGKLKWTSDLDGMFYVYDIGADRIDYEGQVRRGQEIVVQPDEDRVYVAEKVVTPSSQNLRKDAKHAIYIAREHDSSSNHPSGGNYGSLPRDARRMERGTGELTVSKAPGPGTMYVYDDDDKRVIYSCEVRRDDSFKIIPKSDVVHLNGNRYADVRFSHDHHHSLYFLEKR